MRQQSARLELRELGPDRRGRNGEASALHKVHGSDRLSGRDVRRQSRRVSPASPLNCRNRTDPYAEVIAAEPIGEVVLRAEISTARVVRATEIRRLVPAVAGAGQPLDDKLEIRLHLHGLSG